MLILSRFIFEKTKAKTKALDAIGNNCGLGEEHKNKTTGVDKIIKEKIKLFLAIFLTSPIRDINPANCIKLPICSELKTYPRDIITSPDPDNKL